MTTLPKGIYQRGSSYYVRYRHGGKWKHKSAGPNLGAALALSEGLRSEIEYTPEVVRFRDLAERYLKHLDTYAKAVTITRNSYVVKTLLGFFSARAIETLSSTDLQLFIQERQKNHAPRTVNRELSVLKAILRLAVEDELIEKLPFRIRMLKVVEKRTAHVFTAEEINRLLSVADARERLLLLIASATAMRINELLHLQWQDVDSAERTISVRAKHGWTPKTHQERSCYVPHSVIGALTDYRQTLSHNEGPDWVFQNKRRPGKRWACRDNALQRTFKRAGLYQKGKLTHEIRRAVATTMLLNGTPIHVVKEILGHSTIKTTELYAFTNEKAKRDAANNGIL